MERAKLSAQQRRLPSRWPDSPGWWLFSGVNPCTSGHRSISFRLRLLLANSILPLAFCMLGLLLLTIKPVPPGIWRWCSGSAFVILLPFGITTAKSFRRFDPHQLKRARATGFGFYLFSILGTVATLLQVFNAAMLDAFWPFFTGIVVQLVAAMFQFVRIILLPADHEGDSN